MLQQLVANGFDIHQKISFDYFNIRDLPLFYGVFKKKWKHVHLLLDLHLASPPRSSKDTPDKILENLLYWENHGAESDRKLECQAVLKVGRHCTQATLLKCVALMTSRVKPELMQTFITAGANVRNAGNLLSLEMAPECMQILIENGMDVNYQSPEDKSSALHHVIERYFFDYRGKCHTSERNLKILLVHGADLSLRDANGKTALHHLKPDQLREFETMQTNLQVCRGYVRERMLGFCMAGHRRLGANSPAQQLSSDMLCNIMGTKKFENYLTLKIAFVLE